jgi:hypothetical protein
MKKMLILVQDIGMIPEEHIGIKQEIIKVHGCCFETPLDIYLENFAHIGFHGGFIIGGEERIALVFSPGDQPVFSSRYSVINRIRLINLVIEIHFPDDRFQQGLAVIRIINRKFAGKTDFMTIDPENAGKYGMKGSHPDIPGFIADDLLNPMPHFTGRFVGKGQCQDVEGIDPVRPDQMGDLKSEYTGFPRTCSGYDQARPVNIFNGITLFRIQLVKI